MNWVKKLKFFHVLCFSKIHREKVFDDVLDTKETFKDYKKSVYEKRKIRIFPRVLSKIRDFFNFDFYAK